MALYISSADLIHNALLALYEKMVVGGEWTVTFSG